MGNVRDLTKLPFPLLGRSRHLDLGDLKEIFDFSLIESAHVVNVRLGGRERERERERESLHLTVGEKPAGGYLHFLKEHKNGEKGERFVERRS